MSITGSHVFATAVQPDGKTIIAGSFTEVLGVGRNNIARLNANGTLDTTFNPSANNEVSCVAVQPDGKVLLGGTFNYLQPNGAASAAMRNGIARVNADGTLDTGFDPNAGYGQIYCLALQADGKVLLGGSFITLQPNGAFSVETRNRIARVNADGTLDMTFNPNANDSVNSMAVQTDGKVILGGGFTTLRPNGASPATTRNRIARVNADGTLDMTFNPNANNSVTSVAVQADGKVLLGGIFSTPRSCIARVNADGTLDGTFIPIANNWVTSLAVQADGKVLFGGNFSTPTNSIARVNADGTLDTDFNPSPNSYVTSVAMQANGKVLLGGLFTTLQPNGAGSPTSRNFFARLDNDAAIQTLSKPSATQVLWNRSGASPELSAVTFEQSTNGGATWTPLGTGTRLGSTANWQITGLNLPNSVRIRARGRTAGGYYSGSSGLIEQVAAFTPPPSVTQNLGTLAISATTLTITGTNFSTTPGNNTVVFTPAGTGTVTSSTATSLTVTSLSGLALGTLNAVVTTNGQSSGAAVQVASVVSALQNWRQTFFGSTSNTGNAADGADPDSDGVVNLLEYATGQNPNMRNSLSTPATRNGDNYEFTYPRSIAALNASTVFIVEWSDTLAADSWSIAGVSEAVLSSNGGVQQVKATLTAGSAGRRFVRLRVTAPP